MTEPDCWLRKFGRGPCYGRLVRAHLIPKQTLKKNCPPPPNIINRCDAWSRLLWDPRVWVWACGGVMGNASHHGQFDAGKIVIPKVDLPLGLLEFAEEHGLTWWIDKHYPTLTENGVG